MDPGPAPPGRDIVCLYPVTMPVEQHEGWDAVGAQVAQQAIDQASRYMDGPAVAELGRRAYTTDAPGRGIARRHAAGRGPVPRWRWHPSRRRRQRPARTDRGRAGGTVSGALALDRRQDEPDGKVVPGCGTDRLRQVPATQCRYCIAADKRPTGCHRRYCHWHAGVEIGRRSPLRLPRPRMQCILAVGPGANATKLFCGVSWRAWKRTASCASAPISHCSMARDHRARHRAQRRVPRRAHDSTRYRHFPTHAGCVQERGRQRRIFLRRTASRQWAD